MASLIKPGGISNFENELTDSAGMEVADNVVLDAPFIIEKRRGVKEKGNSLPDASDRHKQLLVYKDRVLRHYDDKLQFDTSGDFTFSDFAGTYQELESGLRIKGREANGNFYFTSTSGVKKISALTASDLTTASNYIVTSGATKATDISGKVSLSPAGFLPPNSKVGYFLLWGYKDKNSSTQLGSPSSRLVISNTSVPIYVPEAGTITVTGALTSSQYILFSSKEVDYFAWFDNTGSDTKPQTSETVNRTEVHVNLLGLTTDDQRASAIANPISQLSDFIVEVAANVVTITIADSTSGDVPDLAEQSGGTNNLTVATIAQGSVTEGSNANAIITAQIPQEILNLSDPTLYFYQLYRTAVSTVVAGLTLADLDPGSEANQVFEAQITSVDISNGSISITDITPETFREAGVFLYTNPVTGGGVLSANEKPPIAKDLELFRNYMFYANTKSLHRLTVDMLSVIDFTTGTSDFIVGNSQVARTYTFRGTQESFDLTVDSRSNTTSGGYVNLNSANDAVKYLLWFDLTGSDPAPVVTDRQQIRVDISSGAGVADTALGTATATASALSLFIDFSVITASPVLTISCTNNGNATDATIGSSLGGAWAISNIVNGTGEDTSSNYVLLSGLSSAAQAIEESARSLVRVINADTSSAINAYYISGEDDLPGKLLLESRTIDDIPFYIFTSDSNITDNFNPELPLNESIDKIKFSAGSDSPAKVQSTAHGLSSGDKVYIYNSATVPVILNEFVVTVVDADNFTIPFNITTEDDPSSAFFVRSSNKSDNIVAPNRLYFSKIDQPEAVPLLNYLDIGPKDKGIKRILALRDNLVVLKEDGIYVITGTSSPFTFRLITSSSKLLASDSAVVLDNLIYCLTTQGVVTVSETGVSIISRQIENRILKVTNTGFPFSTVSFGVAYETDRAYILFLPQDKTDTSAPQAYRYNTINRTWTRWTFPATCGVVREVDDRLYFGSGNRSYLLQERKERDRTDFADREIAKSIVTSGVSNNIVELSNIQELAVNDVIYQEQYVSIAFLNMLLRKLDMDPGLDDGDYEALLSPNPGVVLNQSLDALNAKLILDDASGTITDHTPFSSDITIQQTQYNALIAELNASLCDTQFKNYKLAENLVSFEAIIKKVDVPTNKVTLNFAMPFLANTCTIYKAIASTIVFAYQSFQQPDTVKQIREGSILLDQAMFYDAVISFKTDLSQSFSDVPVLGKGIGNWGYPGFGEFVWGGGGTDEGIRVIIPQAKQRCRYLQIKFAHSNAREEVRCLGITLQPRAVSTRGYR